MTSGKPCKQRIRPFWVHSCVYKGHDQHRAGVGLPLMIIKCLSGIHILARQNASGAAGWGAFLTWCLSCIPRNPAALL